MSMEERIEEVELVYVLRVMSHRVQTTHDSPPSGRRRTELDKATSGGQLRTDYYIREDVKPVQ